MAMNAPGQDSSQQGVQPAPQKKGAGLMRRGWRAFRGWRHEQADAKAHGSNQGAETEQSGFRIEAEELDGLERAKLAFARLWLFLSAFLFALIAGWSVGFFFSGLHDFTFSSQEILASYGGSFGLEGVITGLLFTVSFNRKRGRGWRGMFLFACLLALVSVLAQFAAYEALLSQGKLAVSDSQIEQIPLLQWLIGSMKGHSFLFLLRGASFHLAEIGACLFIPSKKRTMQEQVSDLRRVQEARNQYRQAELAARIQEALALEAEQHIMARLQGGQGLLAIDAPTGESEVGPFRAASVASNGTGKR